MSVESEAPEEHGAGHEIFDEMGDPFVGAGVQFETHDGETVVGRVVKGVEGPEHTLVTVIHDGGDETELRWSEVDDLQTKGNWTCTVCGNYSEVPYKCDECGKPKGGNTGSAGWNQ